MAATTHSAPEQRRTTPPAPVAGGGDPRRAMHVQADVVSALQPPFAAVDPHPDTHDRIGRPPMLKQPTLRLQSALHRRRCVSERVEQRISLRPHLHTSLAKGLPKRRW